MLLGGVDCRRGCSQAFIVALEFSFARADFLLSPSTPSKVSYRKVLKWAQQVLFSRWCWARLLLSVCFEATTPIAKLFYALCCSVV